MTELSPMARLASLSSDPADTNRRHGEKLQPAWPKPQMRGTSQRVVTSAAVPSWR